GCKIVEEQERLGALNNEIVDAHGDEIDADRVVLARLNGNLELGADAVIGGNENRVVEARSLQVEQSAKAADFAVGAGAAGRAHERLDLFHQRIAGIDVDACIGVAKSLVFFAQARDLLAHFSGDSHAAARNSRRSRFHAQTRAVSNASETHYPLLPVRSAVRCIIVLSDVLIEGLFWSG